MAKSIADPLVKVGEAYITRTAYRLRIRQARDRLRDLGISLAWVARQIGRSQGHVSNVLNGAVDGPPTLLLVEELIEKVEAEVLR